MAEVSIRRAVVEKSSGDLELVRTLMREYATFLNASVGDEHICVESLEAELAGLPGAYAEPGGTVLLAFSQEGSGGEQAAGCVALKPLDHGDQPSSDRGTGAVDPGAARQERLCEMKRLWVRPEFQGRQIGRKLADAVVNAARERGYSAMYLDTMPASMQAAYGLYRAMGFAPVERYLDNPVLRRPDALAIAYLRKVL
jgi:putative acetyltransferase